MKLAHEKKRVVTGQARQIDFHQLAGVNLVGLSVAVALLVGSIELLQVLIGMLGLHGQYLDAIAALPAPAAPTATIELGQTPDQVKAALGAPTRIANLGPKVIYYYNGMKVTFKEGKVSDVE